MFKYYNDKNCKQGEVNTGYSIDVRHISEAIFKVIVIIEYLEIVEGVDPIFKKLKLPFEVYYLSD